jgi:trimethylamine---corrinoid protein Co-methyltransferase
VSDWQNYENWADAGSRPAEERATAVWQEALERYEQPPLDDDVSARLDEYVARRRVELERAEAGT